MKMEKIIELIRGKSSQDGEVTKDSQESFSTLLASLSRTVALLSQAVYNHNSSIKTLFENQQKILAILEDAAKPTAASKHDMPELFSGKSKTHKSN